MSYLRKNRLWAGLAFFLAAAYHAYFIVFTQIKIEDLLYPDLLFGIIAGTASGIDACRYYKRQAYKKQLFETDCVICRALDTEDAQENLDVAEHDVRVLERQLKEQFDLNCDLSDYIAKWCHEVKLPLSASMLMNEKIEDLPLRTAQKEQLEMIRQQLNGALAGCKVQSSLLDIHICKTDLLDCVKTSIHNNSYFLIQKQFEVVLKTESVFIYTDRTWLVYVLDQLVQNAVKYCSDHPVLTISCTQKQGQFTLAVEDNGEGIKQSDLRRIFERGYTGSSHHNGKYKSTGMGLYLAAQILDRLGYEIMAESQYGVYTRFTIVLGSLTENVR